MSQVSGGILNREVKHFATAEHKNTTNLEDDSRLKLFRDFSGLKGETVEL